MPTTILKTLGQASLMIIHNDSQKAELSVGRERYCRHAWRPRGGFLGIDGQYLLVTMCGDQDFGSEFHHLVGIPGPCQSREFFGCGVQCKDTAGIVVFITALG